MKDTSRHDTTKFCPFHNDYNHDTNYCNHLKDEIKFLIREGHLRLFARPTGNQSPPEARGGNERIERRLCSPPLQSAPVAGTLLTICGGPYLARESSKALERYARTLLHQFDGEMMSIDSQVSKRACVEED